MRPTGAPTALAVTPTGMAGVPTGRAGVPTGMAVTPTGMAGAAGNDGKLARTRWRESFPDAAETLRRVNKAE